VTRWVADTPFTAVHMGARRAGGGPLTPLSVSWALPACESGVRDGLSLKELPRDRPCCIGVFGGHVYVTTVVHDAIRNSHRGDADLVTAGIAADRLTVEKLVGRRPLLAGEMDGELLDRFRSLLLPLRRSVSRAVADIAMHDGAVGWEPDPLGDELWDLSRVVRERAALMTACAQGQVDHIEDDGVVARIDELAAREPWRCVAPWELTATSWGLDSGEVARAVADLAAGDGDRPHLRVPSAAIVNSARLVDEARCAIVELARRAMADGHIESVGEMGFLTDADLDGFVTNPGASRSSITQRREVGELLRSRIPPEVIHGAPAIDEWPST
jgi:hypothetical protein